MVVLQGNAQEARRVGSGPVISKSRTSILFCLTAGERQTRQENYF